jgi:hypothetical protein
LNSTFKNSINFVFQVSTFSKADMPINSAIPQIDRNLRKSNRTETMQFPTIGPWSVFAIVSTLPRGSETILRSETQGTMPPMGAVGIDLLPIQNSAVHQ